MSRRCQACLEECGEYVNCDSCVNKLLTERDATLADLRAKLAAAEAKAIELEERNERGALQCDELLARRNVLENRLADAEARAKRLEGELAKAKMRILTRDAHLSASEAHAERIQAVVAAALEVERCTIGMLGDHAKGRAHDAARVEFRRLADALAAPAAPPETAREDAVKRIECHACVFGDYTNGCSYCLGTGFIPPLRRAPAAPPEAPKCRCQWEAGDTACPVHPCAGPCCDEFRGTGKTEAGGGT